jgi:hypothetical protein
MDASVGLSFSLQLFQRYRRSGTLQATIRHLPGVQGACIAHIVLTDGVVTACYVKNKQGQNLAFSLDELRRLDHERGPFEWVFQQAQNPAPGSQVSAPPSAQPSPRTISLTPELTSEADLLIPKVVTPLRWNQFNHWTPEQKLLLQNVWKNIDGKCTIQDLRASLPYPPELVNDVLQILLTLRIIVLAS